MSFFSRFKPKKRSELTLGRNGLISAVVMGALFGLAAGVVGMLMTIAYLPVISGSELIGYGSAIEPVIVRARLSPDMVVRGLSGPTVLFYQNTDLEKTVVKPTDAIGGGAVLTSDGWLLTHNSILNTINGIPSQELTAVIDGKIYPVERSVVDPYSGAAFLKVNGSGLPVVSMAGLDREPGVGDSIVSFDQFGGLRTAVVTAWNNIPVIDDADAYRSSEAVQRVVFLAETEGFLPGSAIFSTGGEVIGIYMNNDKNVSWAIPLRAFSRQISGILHGEGIIRPYLGVRFLDLSEQLFLKEGNRGVKLSSYGRLLAVVQQSPAAQAGLKENDLILAVNGESVTANRPLSELLSEYSPDDLITLSVERNNERLELEVTLGRMPTP